MIERPAVGRQKRRQRKEATGQEETVSSKKRNGFKKEAGSLAPDERELTTVSTKPGPWRWLGKHYFIKSIRDKNLKRRNKEWDLRK